MNKYWKKSHFISQNLIFHCLKKNPSKKIRFFLYFRSYERSELLVHTNLASSKYQRDRRNFMQINFFISNDICMCMRCIYRNIETFHCNTPREINSHHNCNTSTFIFCNSRIVVLTFDISLTSVRVHVGILLLLARFAAGEQYSSSGRKGEWSDAHRGGGRLDHHSTRSNDRTRFLRNYWKSKRLLCKMQ